MSNTSSFKTPLALAGAALALTLAALPAEARNHRSHYQDHRNGSPNHGGSALPGGPRIQCVVFCGNSFTPRGQGSAPHYQDHRPGRPLVDNNGNHIGTVPYGGTRNDIGWNGNHPRNQPNPYNPNAGGGAAGNHPGVHVPGVTPPRSNPHYQDHRGDNAAPMSATSTRANLPTRGRPPHRPLPVIDPGIGNGGSASGHNYGNPGRTPIFSTVTFDAAPACTYEWRRVNGKRRQVKVCAVD